MKRLCYLLAFLLLFTSIIFAQRYQERQDPKNPKRKILTLQTATRKAQMVVQTRNVLDADNAKKPPIAFQPFEMRHPRTGKPLNPNATLTINMPDGSKRVTTVKQYYEQLNALENALAVRGRTLRNPSAFAGLKPDFNATVYNNPPVLAPGFKSGKFEVKKSNASPNLMIPIGGVSVKNSQVITSTIAWDANLLIAEYYQNHGTPEFPAKWVTESGSSKGRTTFPLIVQVPKGFEGLIKKLEWQVSDKPFDGTLKNTSAAAPPRSGIVLNPKWSSAIQSANLPIGKNYTYTDLYINLASIEPEPVNIVKPYYIRVICYDAAGDVFKVTDPVVANYGGINKPFKVAVPSVNTVPGFSYSFPEGATPFGVFIRGSGLNSRVNNKWKDETYQELIPAGYGVTGGASIGVKYFNFLSLVNSSEPVNKEFTLVQAQFKAALGSGTTPSGGNETNGITLKLSGLDGLIDPTPISFNTKLPGTNIITLEYDVKQPLDIELLHTRFTIGPVPMIIKAAIRGEAGVRLSGQANADNFDVTGTITPFVSTRFEASGGVDAFIAYATLNAEVNPLLSLELPMSFTSTGKKPLTFNGVLSGLGGRVYLKVGFYYPCPSVEKIVGFLTGDEDLPLCECKWEYNIFDFKGFEHTYGY